MFIVDRILYKYTNYNQVFSKHLPALRSTVPATLTMTTLTLRMTPTRAKALTLSTIVSIQCTHTHTPHTHTPHTHPAHTHILSESVPHTCCLSLLPHNAAPSALSRTLLCKPNRHSITHTTWWPPKKALLHKVASRLAREGRHRATIKAAQRWQTPLWRHRQAAMLAAWQTKLSTKTQNKIEYIK